jgi:hypothetical protein
MPTRTWPQSRQVLVAYQLVTFPCVAENPSSFTGQPPGRRNLSGAGDVAAPNICMHVSTST